MDTLATAELWLEEGRKIALATVLSTWGSAPRAAGSHLIVDPDGDFEGSVSGGCVEGAVIAAACEVIENDASQVLEFGVADETAWEVGLSCGGKISVHIAVADAKTIQRINNHRERRAACLTVADLSNGSIECIEQVADAPTDLAEQIRSSLQSGKCVLVEREGRSIFLRPYVPPIRIVVIGAAHISQALAPMARIVGYSLEVIDPRTAFATAQRFPDTKVHAKWPEEVFQGSPLDPYCALVAVTHDPKIDDFPIIEAIKSRCFYVGSLGSRKTHGKRLERLQELGMKPDQLAEIKAPIGLDIKAATPQEIAVSILAEIIEAHRARSQSQ